MPLDRVADSLPVLLEHLCVSLSAFLQQAGGSLDVGEDERDRSARELGHEATVPPLPPDGYSTRSRRPDDLERPAQRRELSPVLSRPVASFILGDVRQ